jgi:hypothetical protein
MRFVRHPMSLLWAIALSIPFYFLWNWLAPVYAPGLPPLYLHLPFLHCVGLLLLASILRMVLLF